MQQTEWGAAARVPHDFWRRRASQLRTPSLDAGPRARRAPIVSPDHFGDDAPIFEELVALNRRGQTHPATRSRLLLEALKARGFRFRRVATLALAFERAPVMSVENIVALARAVAGEGQAA